MASQRFFLWGPKVLADNNADRQLGIIMAVRETTRVFKDHLTKVSSNEYDPNLVIADTDFRNDAERWILPARRQVRRRHRASARICRRAARRRRRPRANSISAVWNWSG